MALGDYASITGSLIQERSKISSLFQWSRSCWMNSEVLASLQILIFVWGIIK
uniref:Uncharacterized protein n=1 Tax=Arundo donax TaxID=35708 RepID=A0A0A8XUX6_ARUDO